VHISNTFVGNFGDGCRPSDLPPPTRTGLMGVIAISAPYRMGKTTFTLLPSARPQVSNCSQANLFDIPREAHLESPPSLRGET
jgi:hypothetical protein